MGEPFIPFVKAHSVQDSRLPPSYETIDSAQSQINAKEALIHLGLYGFCQFGS